MSEAKKDYIINMRKVAERLWGEEEIIIIDQHIETTASAVWNIGQIVLVPENEPATKLRHEVKI